MVDERFFGGGDQQLTGRVDVSAGLAIREWDTLQIFAAGHGKQDKVATINGEPERRSPPPAARIDACARAKKQPWLTARAGFLQN